MAWWIKNILTLDPINSFWDVHHHGKSKTACYFNIIFWKKDSPLFSFIDTVKETRNLKIYKYHQKLVSLIIMAPLAIMKNSYQNPKVNFTKHFNIHYLPGTSQPHSEQGNPSFYRLTEASGLSCKTITRIYTSSSVFFHTIF